MPDETVTIAVKDLTEIASAVNLLRGYTRRHVSECRNILQYADTAHTSAWQRAIYDRDKAAARICSAIETLISFGIATAPLVADIDQTLPAQIECTCGWCTGEWK